MIVVLIIWSNIICWIKAAWSLRRPEWWRVVMCLHIAAPRVSNVLSVGSELLLSFVWMWMVNIVLHHVQMNSASHRHYPAYHTVIDNSDYMERFIDPSFSAHVSLAQLAADIVLQLSSSVRLPLDIRELADTLELEYDSLQQDGMEEFNYLLGIYNHQINAGCLWKYFTVDFVKVLFENIDGHNVVHVIGETHFYNQL